VPQKRIIDYIDAVDTLADLKLTGHLLECIQTLLSVDRDSEKTLEAIHYLFSIYDGKLKELMPKLEAIIEGKD
jgi:hypothetical protein